MWQVWMPLWKGTSYNMRWGEGGEGKGAGVSWQASKKKLSWQEEGGFTEGRRGFLYVVMVRPL